MSTADKTNRKEKRNRLIRSNLLFIGAAGGGLAFAMINGAHNAPDRDVSAQLDQSTGQVTGCTITDTDLTVNGTIYRHAWSKDETIILTSTEGKDTILTDGDGKLIVTWPADADLTVKDPGLCSGVNGITG